MDKSRILEWSKILSMNRKEVKDNSDGFVQTYHDINIMQNA